MILINVMLFDPGPAGSRQIAEFLFRGEYGRQFAQHPVPESSRAPFVKRPEYLLITSADQSSQRLDMFQCLHRSAISGPGSNRQVSSPCYRLWRSVGKASFTRHPASDSAGNAHSAAGLPGYRGATSGVFPVTDALCNEFKVHVA